MLEEIPNFPQAFMDRHMNWHTMTPPDGRTIFQGLPGSGAEFLDFHHQFILDVKTWYATQPGADPSKLAAWAHFPPDLAAAYSPELANFQAYASNAANFTTEDALGIYVEAEHNTVHNFIASLYSTPAFAAYDSCMFFVFYQWHGLIDSWRGNWLVHHKRALKDTRDHKWYKETIHDVNVKHVREHFPPKSPKESVEVPGVIEQGDPFELLSNRISQVETMVHRQAFIRASQRPKVG